MNTLSEPILIYGAGAIGGTLGAHFVRTGHEVLFVDRAPEHVEAMQARGLRIEGSITEFTVRANAVLNNKLEGSFQTVFLCVKAHHTREAVRVLEPHLALNGFVVSAQNGLNELEIEFCVVEYFYDAFVAQHIGERPDLDALAQGHQQVELSIGKLDRK